MKGTYEIDPAAHDFGPATAAIRKIFAECANVDWFAKTQTGGGLYRTTPPEEAERLFAEHVARAHAFDPEHFPESVETRLVVGGWSEFAELSARVRNPSGWDWKYSALKMLSRAHSKARGWSLLAQETGVLFLRFGDQADQVVWKMPTPKLDFATFVPPAQVEAAVWYWSYANMDVLECVEWQLAEGSSEVDGNPFLPLLGCIAAGLYPFAISAKEFVLFGFRA